MIRKWQLDISQSLNTRHPYITYNSNVGQCQAHWLWQCTAIFLVSLMVRSMKRWEFAHSVTITCWNCSAEVSRRLRYTTCWMAPQIASVLFGGHMPGSQVRQGVPFCCCMYSLRTCIWRLYLIFTSVGQQTSSLSTHANSHIYWLDEDDAIDLGKSCQLSLYHNCDSTTIRLQYDYDTTTTKNWHVHFAHDSIYAKRAYAIAIPSVCPSVCLSVCPSVRHTGDSCKNGWS